MHVGQLSLQTIAFPLGGDRCAMHVDASPNQDVASPSPRCMIHDLGLHDRLISASDARAGASDSPLHGVD